MLTFSFAKDLYAGIRLRLLITCFGLIAGLLLASVLAVAQPRIHNLRYDLPEEVLTVVEKAPEFPGGMKALGAYLKQTIQYPAEARKAGFIGRVFVGFIVEVDGRLTDIQLLKGVGFGCDEEALRVVRAMPAWKPGSQSGRFVRVRCNLPVHFGRDYLRPKGD
ncbi:energy transducer TonB [Spirosoma taeanense]|uniref:Energy transducer TonB n=1 Tax=Spirosoma taeanense TaxID=2735870 RepID=A0A6M5YAW4_9BACT|nr:energy transducer TonB [Spirosoma taeanense]QJW91307.1 energy transducer TonB [Spirosoma taeanense]